MPETCSQYEYPQTRLCEGLNWALHSAAAAGNYQLFLSHSHQASLDWIVSSLVPSTVCIASAVARYSCIFIYYDLLFLHLKDC